MPGARDPFRAPPRRTMGPPAPLAGRPPRVAAIVHHYLPAHNAGAEAMLHALLRHLLGHGWDVRVISTEHRGPAYMWDGVTVEAGPDDASAGAAIEWADVAITHLHSTRRALGWCRRGRPLVHVVHNHTQLTTQRVTSRDAALVLWNSEWIAAKWQWWGGPSMVVRPPVDPAEYRTENADRFLCGSATLINLTAVKGGNVFWQLAERRPDLPFLGVIGAYYNQELREPIPDNVEVVENTPDIVSVYQRTRVLLVPSVYESWGRVAVEAAASGIPIVAASTDGLRECMTSPTLGECAMFVDVDDLDAWDTALRFLDSRDCWDTYAGRARARAAELADVSRNDLTRFTDAMALLARGESLDHLRGSPLERPEEIMT